ncbi:hypothetical protein [Bacillus sp. T33-2]|uniref:hypothetical protein n=1 Tax=Bacillus sp. T33-2 TaxID=2054168 RepID=UPI000C778DE9|nr:hypothetical protein [Bacillus sp. T33-2]PLR98527.1 hypothetical protein CVD19_05515 [Bacillus sp. T33-2]
MDNKIFLEKLVEIQGLKIHKHPKNDLYNGECVTRQPHHRRQNVVGDISPTGSSFILYADGKWVSKNKLGIRTVDEAIEWIKKDIEFLSK